MCKQYLYNQATVHSHNQQYTMSLKTYTNPVHVQYVQSIVISLSDAITSKVLLILKRCIHKQQKLFTLNFGETKLNTNNKLLVVGIIMFSNM